MDIFNYFFGDNPGAGGILFYQGLFQKGTKMKKTTALCLLIIFLLLNILGCAPLIVGSAAVGALGTYAVSKDTVQGETDKSYDSLWNAALTVSRIRGSIKQ